MKIVFGEQEQWNICQLLGKPKAATPVAQPTSADQPDERANLQ
jgi:hypothetical protein